MKKLIALTLLLTCTAYGQTQSADVTTKTSTDEVTAAKSPYQFNYYFRNRNLSSHRSVNFATRSTTAYPTKLDVRTQVIGGSYRLNNDISVGLSANHLYNSIDLNIPKRDQMGRPTPEIINAKTHGMSDTTLALKHSQKLSPTQTFTSSLGLSLPTGSVDEKSGTRALPYTAQLGSGTYDFKPTLYYRGGSRVFRYGTRYSGKFRTGRNKNNYRLGNESVVSAYGGFSPIRGIMGLMQVNYKANGGASGSDKNVLMQRPVHGGPPGPPQMITFDPYKDFVRSKTNVEALVGLDVTFPVKGFLFRANASIPFYQKQDSPFESQDFFTDSLITASVTSLL